VVKKLLIPLDGSALAERALAYATALSIPTCAQLVLVRAVTAHTLPGVDAREPQVRALTEARNYLSDVAHRLMARGFVVEVATPYGESPAEWIVEEARLRKCDLIVMTTHGRTGPGRWWFGSVAEAVVAHSRLPVLLDRAWQPSQRELLLADQPRLLVPLDGSTFAESVLDVAAGLAEDLGAELVVVRVDPRPRDVFTAEQAIAEGEEDALALEESEYLQNVTESLGRDWPDLRVRTELRFGPPAEAITSAAIESNAALVVMATHGRTGVVRTVVGSVAGRMLEFDTAPLVLVHPSTLEQSDKNLEVNRPIEAQGSGQ
jgi:nucleotide-binding universal stress UspA family protein